MQWDKVKIYKFSENFLSFSYFSLIICLSKLFTTTFFRIRDCQVILLLASLRGAYLNAPYVDEYGETDFGFR